MSELQRRIQAVEGAGVGSAKHEPVRNLYRCAIPRNGRTASILSHRFLVKLRRAEWRQHMETKAAQEIYKQRASMAEASSPLLANAAYYSSRGRN